jgi:hypothetical protein
VFLSHQPFLRLSFSNNVLSKKKFEIAWYKFRSLGFILAEKIKRREIRKTSCNLEYSWSYYRTPNMVAHREAKEDAPNMSAEIEWTMLHVVWRDRLTNVEIRQRTNTKHIVKAAHSLKWKWRAHVARIDQRRWPDVTSMWGVRVGRGRTG